jgi:hypothetical protein
MGLPLRERFHLAAEIVTVTIMIPAAVEIVRASGHRHARGCREQQELLHRDFSPDIGRTTGRNLDALA